MEIEYVCGLNFMILFPEYFKSKTLPDNIKEIIFKELMEEYEDEKE